MADSWVDDPYLAINGVDYSLKIRSISLTGGRQSVDRTAGGDGGTISMPGLRIWRCEVTVKDDYANGGLDDALWALAEAGTPFILRVRPTSDAVANTNPEYVTTGLSGLVATAGAIFEGPFDLVSGAVGALAEKTLVIIPGAPQTRLMRTEAAI